MLHSRCSIKYLLTKCRSAHVPSLLRALQWLPSPHGIKSLHCLSCHVMWPHPRLPPIPFALVYLAPASPACASLRNTTHRAFSLHLLFSVWDTFLPDSCVAKSRILTLVGSSLTILTQPFLPCPLQVSSSTHTSPLNTHVLFAPLRPPTSVSPP